MSFVDYLVNALHGPFGDQPFAILAWQALIGAAVYFVVRFLRGRIPLLATAPFRVAGQGTSKALRNRYVLVAIGLTLPLFELLTGGYLLTVTYSIELYVLLAIGLLGVVCTAVAFLLFFALIAEVGPVRATIITYVNPAVALALGVALLGEPLTIGAVAGFALILAGLFLATRRQRTARPTREPANEPLVEAR